MPPVVGATDAPTASVSTSTVGPVVANTNTIEATVPACTGQFCPFTSGAW
jgi:hypothetical protein